jgi:hypothetical protein
MRPRPILAPELPPAAPDARFELRDAGFRAFLRARYGDCAQPCADSALSGAEFIEHYQCAPEPGPGSLCHYTRAKWSVAWRAYVAESGL